MSEQQPSTTQGSPRRSRRWIVAGSILGSLALLGGAMAFAHVRDGGRYSGWGGPMQGEFMADHIEHGVKYVLSDVDATAEQKAQITSIMQSAATDVHAVADEHRALHRQLHEILSAQTIDRTRLEAVRADGLRLADQASKRILDGIADAAEVLTPEQRAELAAHALRHDHH